MRLATQWAEIVRGLPEQWREAQLVLALERESDAPRAAAVLGPTGAGRRGGTVRFSSVRGGGGAGPEAVMRLLRRLDSERVAGGLELVGAAERDATVTPVERLEQPSLVVAWDRAVDGLPDDWSDAYVEVELRSSDHLERAALLMSPLNPARDGDRLAVRFRAARVFGYGASAGMARRCLERCANEGIGGSVRILRALSDTDPVKTQGPVWYIGGRAV